MSEPDFDISNFDIDEEETSDPQGVDVVSPSGSTVAVMNQTEADFYTEMVQRYTEDNKFKNVNDFLELDRVLLMETMCYRWGLWILAGEDYQGRKINAVEVQKSIATYSKEIREIKKDLGLDKLTREKDQGTNFAEYMNNLRIRAKEFGIHRDNQIIEAINMLKKIFAAVTLHRNSNERERKEFGATEQDIINLIFKCKEEFDAIDQAFQKNQKIWVRNELNND